MHTSKFTFYASILILVFVPTLLSLHCGDGDWTTDSPLRMPDASTDGQDAPYVLDLHDASEPKFPDAGKN